MDVKAELENNPYNETTETDDEERTASLAGTEVTMNANGRRNSLKKNKKKVNYIKTIEGMLMFVNTFFIMLSWVIMAGWRDSVKNVFLYEIESHSIFLAVAVIASIINGVFLVIFVFRIHESRLNTVNWNVVLILNCGIDALLILITSSITLSEVKSTIYMCSHLKCSTIRAAGAFGILAVLGSFVQGVLHLRNYLKNQQDVNKKQTLLLQKDEDKESENKSENQEEEEDEEGSDEQQ